MAFLRNLFLLFSEVAMQRCSSKQVLLEIFAIFTGKNQCWSHFLTLFQPRLTTQVILVKIAKSLQTAFFMEHLQWLLLSVQ